MVLYLSPMSPQPPHAFASRSQPFLRATFGAKPRATPRMIAELFAAARTSGALGVGLPGKRRLDVSP